MKKQLDIIKMMLIITGILAIVETLFLIIEHDLKHIILSIVVYIGVILIILMYFICLKEVKKIIFETKDDNYEIRLINYDDYQTIRALLDEHNLENTPEEVKRLEEYKMITIDFTRIPYHYIVFSSQKAVGVFYASNKKEQIDIEFKNKFSEKEIIKEQLIKIGEKFNHKINFLN